VISRVRKALGAAAIAALGFTAFTGAHGPQGRPARPPVVVQPPPPAQAAGRGGSRITWDFETGNLSGWTATGDAFANQPTLGDNPALRGSGSANPQGKYWIGTFEFYTGARGKPGAAQGDKPTGTLTSNTFNIPPSLTFLIGGGSSKSTRVELLVAEPIDGALISVQSASGKNSEAMFDVTWNLRAWAGRPGRIRIVDQSSDSCGHINVDDFRFGTGVRPGIDTYSPPRWREDAYIHAHADSDSGTNTDADANADSDANAHPHGHAAADTAPGIRPESVRPDRARGDQLADVRRTGAGPGRSR
jgi:hypothetical protein